MQTFAASIRLRTSDIRSGSVERLGLAGSGWSACGCQAQIADGASPVAVLIPIDDIALPKWGVIILRAPLGCLLVHRRGLPCRNPERPPLYASDSC